MDQDNIHEFDNELTDYLVDNDEPDLGPEDILDFEEDQDEFAINLLDDNELDDTDYENINGVEGDQIQQNNLIDSLLKSKGIENTTVKYENETGDLEDFNFYELPLEDQMSILNTPNEVLNDLDEAEISAVNFLRENNVNLEEAIEYYKREAVKEYLDNQNIAGIEVDQYSDEELFALDLKARYEDFTEDEIQLEVNKQLEHPDLFKKKIDKLRTEYKDVELKQLEQSKVEAEEKELEVQTELQNNLITVAQSVEDIGGLDLDVDDKNEVLSFILKKDLNGTSPLEKALQDPDTLFGMAWYATKGKQAFDILHDYYKKQIETVSKTSYEKGKSESTKSAPVKTAGKTFVRTNATKAKDNILSIHDLKIE